jgi:hypothetical protein
LRTSSSWAIERATAPHPACGLPIMLGYLRRSELANKASYVRGRRCPALAADGGLRVVQAGLDILAGELRVGSEEFGQIRA